MALSPPLSAAQPVFYYDLGDPLCYVVAERVISELGVMPDWEPVVASRLLGAVGPRRFDRSLIGRLATEAGLQPLRWPAGCPESSRAGLAATYAKRVGRGVAFSLACFRQVFAAGRDPEDEDTLLIAGAACEMHPRALLKAIEQNSVAQALEATHRRALAAGVRELPAIQTTGRTLAGPNVIELTRAAARAAR